MAAACGVHAVASRPRQSRAWHRFKDRNSAVRIRLLEIGEAVKALLDDLLATQPSIPWRQIARMRDHLAHRYFDTAHAILQATVDEDLPDLGRAVQALTRSVEKEDPDPRPGTT